MTTSQKEIVSKKKAKKKDTKIGQSGGISAGRPKGSKNKTTLFKEVIKDGFEEKMLSDGMAVIEAVIAKAKEGDLTAAKLLLDRILPVSKAVDLNAASAVGSTGIHIHIEKLIADTGRVGEDIDMEDAEIVEE